IISISKAAFRLCMRKSICVCLSDLPGASMCEWKGQQGMRSVSDLKIKIFADGADLQGMLEIYREPYIRGFTTNPTLMRKAGISDYQAFARKVLAAIPDRPISFEVFADEFSQMESQALEIASWGKNVNVKIPVMNTKGSSSAELIASLSRKG